MNAFNQLSPQINTIFNSDESVLKKTKFTYNYITFVIDNPYLPPFVIQEMNNNPEYVMKFLNKIQTWLALISQIEKEIKLGL
jgi:hypothetical protein